LDSYTSAEDEMKKKMRGEWSWKNHYQLQARLCLEDSLFFGIALSVFAASS
jgi:hypothetical protein